MRRWIAAALLCVAGCAPSEQVGRSERPSQIAHLNHFYATLDAETAAAIAKSEFLRRFANFEIRTTTGTQSSWSGIYLYGRETYAEFFGPNGFQIDGRPAPVGSWGLAVSGDRPGHVVELQSRLAAAGYKSVVEVDTRTFGESKVPWFTALTAVSEYGDSGGRNDIITAWAMEYVPSYLDLPQVAKEPAEGAHDIISRERYQSDAYRDRWMRDVTRIEFDVPHRDYARIEPLLKAAGFRISRSAKRMLADGEQTDLVFSLTADGTIGLRKIDFSLNAPVAAHVEIIGKSRLSVGPGATAQWVFH